MEYDPQAPDTYEDFDIYSLESELKAQRQIDYESGEYDEIPAEDADVPDSMPLPDALNLVDASRGDGIQFLTGIAEQMLAKFTAESKKLTVSADHRSLHANMALGVEKLLIEWGARVAEAEERMQQSTPEERRKMGVANVRDILEPEPQAETPKCMIDVGPSSIAEPSVPAAEIQSNTKRAQEWLKKTDANRD